MASSDNLDNIAANLDGDAAVEERVKAKVRLAKSQETLDEAYQRITALKLDERERRIVDDVFALWRTERQSRPEGRLSKKACFVAWEAWLASERERKKRKVVETKPTNCWIVVDETTLASLEMALMFEDIVALDTETTGVDIFEDRIVGVSGYFPKSDKMWYVPFGHTTGQRQLDKALVLDFWRKCVTGRKTIWHNAKFDLHMTLNSEIMPDAPWWDTMVAQRILNNNEDNYRLKDLYAKYVSHDEAILFEDLFDDAVIYDKDIELAGIYAAGDAYKTWRLYEFQKPYIDTRDRLHVVWYEIEQKLLHIDFLTERNGVNVDLDWLSRLGDELRPKLVEAERKVRESFGLDESFNFNSPQQLAHLVYDVAGADPTFPRRFKKQDRSTAADVLDALCDELPQLAPLLEYRTIEKLLGTYVEKIPGAMEPTDGKLHFTLNANDTDTGRYASRGYGNKSKPKGLNFQNIPTRTKEGKQVRMAFVPAPGNVFVGADLSQIEPRVIAHILYTEFGDDSMKRIYDEGVDLYTTMAMQTFDLPRENCVDKAMDPTNSFEPRRLMKTGVLAYLYGQSPKAFARKMSVDDEVAAKFFDGMTKAFPGLAPFRKSIIDGLETRGNVAFAETLFGRKRRFPNYRKDLAELRSLEAERYYSLSEAKRNRLWELRRFVSRTQREAVNTRIQGTAADVIKKIVIRYHEVIVVGRGWALLATIHDETFGEAPVNDVTPETIALVNDVMTKTVTLAVPLKADVVIEPRWMEEYKPADWDYERGCPIAA